MEAQKATTDGLIENNGIELAAVHTPDDDGNALCGATTHTGPVNVEAEQAEAHWCEECKEVEN
jgi:hypothetical protein